MSKLFGFLSGVVVGALGTNWFYTQGAGQKVKDKAAEAKSKAHDFGQEAKQKAEEFGKDLKYKGEEVGEKLKTKA